MPGAHCMQCNNAQKASQKKSEFVCTAGSIAYRLFVNNEMWGWKHTIETNIATKLK